MVGAADKRASASAAGEIPAAFCCAGGGALIGAGLLTILPVVVAAQVDKKSPIESYFTFQFQAEAADLDTVPTDKLIEWTILLRSFDRSAYSSPTFQMEAQIVLNPNDKLAGELLQRDDRLPALIRFLRNCSLTSECEVPGVLTTMRYNSGAHLILMTELMLSHDSLLAEADEETLLAILHECLLKANARLELDQEPPKRIARCSHHEAYLIGRCLERLGAREYGLWIPFPENKEAMRSSSLMNIHGKCEEIVELGRMYLRRTARRE